MIYTEAMRLLDRVKDGTQYPAKVVAEALAMTGDKQHATDVPCPEIEQLVQALRQAGAPVSGTILALDLGTTTGWACRPLDNTIVHGWASFKPGRYEGGGMRYLRFKQWLSELKGTLGGELQAVYFEEVRRHASTDSAHVYGGLMATLTAWCEHHKIPYQGVPVGTIKRHTTGKGNADKVAMVEAIRLRGHPVTDDNEADALALLYWALECNV